MELIIGIVAAVAFSFAFKKPLKAQPWVFYLLAIAIDIVFYTKCLYGVAPGVSRLLNPYMQRCIFAFGLFTVVMFIGVFPERTWVRRYLSPIRSQLSILAGILTVGHFANYLSFYLSTIFSNISGIKPSLLVSFAISAIMIVLLAVLVITSFNYIRQKMNTDAWAKIQRASYFFYGLVYVHLCLVLVPTLGTASSKSLVSIIIYSLIFLLYTILRIKKAFDDKAKAAGQINE